MNQWEYLVPVPRSPQTGYVDGIQATEQPPVRRLFVGNGHLYQGYEPSTNTWSPPMFVGSIQCLNTAQ